LNAVRSRRVLWEKRAIAWVRFDPGTNEEVISMGEKNHENLEKPNKSELPPKDRGNIAKEIGKIAVKGTTSK
jgi:hypothetical protein